MSTVQETAITRSTIQAFAIKKAIALLHASGARYCVLTEDGTKFGDLEVVPERPATMRRARMFNHVATHDYIARISAAKPRDVIEFACGSNDEAVSLRGSISARFGGDANVTTQKQDGEAWIVTCLVVMPQAPAGQQGLKL
jgi:hypothetical protein